MKHSLAAILAASAVITMVSAPGAFARQTIRVDLPYPYGPAGEPSADEWAPVSGPFTPLGNTGVSLPFNYTLISGPGITTDDFAFGNAVLGSQSIQNVGYAAAVPTDPYSDTPPVHDIAPAPLTQILEYKLAGPYLGDTEFEFNYDASFTSSTVGTASLTFGGVTYTSVGNTLPLADADSGNFVFDAAGKYVGSFFDTSGTLSNTGGSAPIGWTSSAGGTGGGGGVSAPEIDPSSATAALTLLAGGLAMLFSGRRSLKAVR